MEVFGCNEPISEENFNHVGTFAPCLKFVYLVDEVTRCSDILELFCANKTKEKWRVEFAFFTSLSTGNKRFDRSSSRIHSNTGKVLKTESTAVEARGVKSNCTNSRGIETSNQPRLQRGTMFLHANELNQGKPFSFKIS